MGKAIYRCTGCKITFGRKYNAERHNKDMHNELAVIYAKENDWVSSKRKIGTIAPELTTHNTPTSATTAADSKIAYINNIRAEEKPQNPNFNFRNFANINDDISETNTGESTDVVKFFKFFEKLTHLIDELDNLLRNYKTNMERTKILSDTITLSLMSSDPFKFIKDKISDHRIELGFEKASGYLALSENIIPQQAKIKLKALAWNSPYFKRSLNNAVYK